MNINLSKQGRVIKPILLLSVLLGFTMATYGQTPVNVSASTGFIVVNTDQVSQNEDISKAQFIYGGTVSLFTQFFGRSAQVNIGYSRGESTIFSQFDTDDISLFRFKHRYNTIPLEVLLTQRISDWIVIAAGVNTVMQYRTLIYGEIDRDRLLSFGTGLSMQIQLELNEHRSGRMQTIFTLSGRWTEFFLHDSNGRDISDYSYRHILISPNLGFRFLI